MRTAIIGGTGIGEILRAAGGRAIVQQTPFGEMNALERSDGILVLSRHGSGHKLPPHKVPYRAIASGLKALGVHRCLATAAVGSLREDMPPGTIAAVSDFIDFSGRNITMFDEEVRHTDFTPGVSPALVSKMHEAGVEFEAVYACTNGPRYETPAEIRALKQLGADVVGMTVASEAVVMREVGIEYGCIAIVTNFASGIGAGALSHEEVLATGRSVADPTISILLTVATGP